nr:immunoglobulin light chain junction region [Macaca mulatta]
DYYCLSYDSTLIAHWIF